MTICQHGFLKVGCEACELIDERAEVLAELAKHLSPGNENVRCGDVLASIKDLAQIAYGRQDFASSSAQPCGCDSGEGWVCERHQPAHPYTR